MKIRKKLIKEVILYGIIGGFSALLDTLLFAVMYEFFSINMFFANTISVHVGIFTSFLLNRKYNFKKTDRVMFRASSFYLTGLLGLLLSHILLWAGTALSFRTLLVKVASVFIVAIVQFTINKLIAFR